MEVGFRKVHVSPYNISFCIYSDNINVYNKAVLDYFLRLVFL